MEDSRIIALYRERSEEAVSETEKKYGKMCRSIARNILRNEADAEECTSDVYLTVWNCIPPQEPYDFCAYIAKITRNLAFNRRKAKGRQKRGGGRCDAVLEELSAVLQDTEDIEDISEGLRIRELIERYLFSIDSDKRKGFVMRYWFCDSISDIALSLGMSKGQVKMMLLRTRKDLKIYLEKEDVSI